MSGVAWTKFFWSDWRSDPCLRLCSHAAKGFWMDLLAIAAEAEPIGYVVVNGRALDAPELSRITGASETDVRSWLDELEKNGVFSRDRNGRIMSRRMVRDAKKAKDGKKFGKLGGNPSLRKQKDIERTLNPHESPPDKVGSGISQKPEANSHMPSSADADEAPSADPRNDREFAVWLRRLCAESPVALSLDVHEIRNLIDEGVTRDDVQTGVAAAIANMHPPPRTYRQLAGWCRRAAKDRLASATLAGSSPRTSRFPTAAQATSDAWDRVIDAVENGASPELLKASA